MHPNPYESPKEHSHFAADHAPASPEDLNSIILLTLASSAALWLFVLAAALCLRTFA
jgi:hypothetical protein